MQIIDGKEVAASLRREIAAEVAAWVAGGNRTPHLVAILVGNDGASQTYVGHKEKCCGEVGFRSTVLRLPEETSEETLLGEIARLNADPQVDGFIVQLPLPKHISEQRVIEAIDPKKDVDGFHPVNTGRMISGLPSYLPATPDGILELLKYYGIETAGRHCVVIGRSNIVGRPIANLLSQKGWDCTVTLCHSRTKDLKKVVRGGDIVIAALGKAEFVTADMVKDGAVVVDVGITRVPSDKTKSGWKQLGDVKFDEVAGSGRRRADDDHLVDEEYAESRTQGSLQIDCGGRRRSMPPPRDRKNPLRNPEGIFRVSTGVFPETGWARCFPFCRIGRGRTGDPAAVPLFLLAADAYGVVTAHERLQGRRASQPEMVGDHHRQLQVHQCDPRAYLRGARNVFVGDIRFDAFVREIEPRLQVERIPARQQDPVGYSHVETRPRVGDFSPSR